MPNIIKGYKETMREYDIPFKVEDVTTQETVMAFSRSDAETLIKYKYASYDISFLEYED